MADDTDFIGLYRELDIGADCDAEAFRRAYRRRVAELHPDRSRDPAAAEALKSLNLRFAAALAFAREHGRLPGAVPGAARAPVRAPAPAPRPAAARAEPGGAGAGGGVLRLLLAVTVLVGAVWMFLPAGEPGGAGYVSGAASVPAVATRRAAPSPALAVGQERAAVRAGQGEPESRSGPRWLYGPSWIEFHCERVIDWYSSPLRPLNAGTGRPPAPAEPAARRPCAPAAADRSRDSRMPP